MREREGLWPSFPIDQPIWSGSPSIPVDKERKVRIMEEKFAVEPFNRDRDDILASDEVKRSVGMVEKGLSLQGFQAHDLEAARAGNAELGSQEVDGR